MFKLLVLVNEGVSEPLELDDLVISTLQQLNVLRCAYGSLDFMELLR